MIRVLALSPLPEEGAGCRFRIAQFIPYLRSVGIDVALRTLYDAEFFDLVYRRGQYAGKAMRFTELCLRQVNLLRQASRFDAIFIYRELFPIGPALGERLLASRKPLIFDFDDAVFLRHVSDANRFLSALKMPSKLSAIIGQSDHVITGNEYLAAYARRFNDAVSVIPTCVDTAKFTPSPFAPWRNRRDASDEPIIGWIGSQTTGRYVRELAPVFRRVREEHSFVLRVSGALEPFELSGIRIEEPRWTLATEVELYNTCDIGVYPLPDCEWSKGKCGFKAIAFMACAVPVVAAAVGANRDIVQDGVNGFLAASEDEWVEKLGRLVADPELRRRLGEAGRRTVEERYSLRVHAPSIAAVVRSVLKDTRSG
jgi:glycosyltransferase involved in cell wall biosynthesis